MGVVASIAQGVMDGAQIALPMASIHDIPNIPQDVAVKGVVDAVLEVTNHDPLGATAHLKGGRTYLATPPLKDQGNMHGPFAWFDLPDVKVGLGKQSTTFTADYVLTNSTLLEAWTAQFKSGAEVRLVVTGDEVVSVNPLDPVRYTLKLNKEVKCTKVETNDPTNDDPPPVYDKLSMKCEYVGQAEPQESWDSVTFRTYVNDDYCLDLKDGKAKAGQGIVLDKCDKKKTSQLWLWEYNADGSRSVKYSTDSSKCWHFPDISSTSSNRFMVLEDCAESSPNQSFRYDAKTQSIRPTADDGLCLDLPDEKLKCHGGCKVGLAACSTEEYGVRGQDWVPRPFESPKPAVLV